MIEIRTDLPDSGSRGPGAATGLVFGGEATAVDGSRRAYAAFISQVQASPRFRMRSRSHLRNI